MLRFEVAADDLARSRFALSPAFELCGLLRALAYGECPLPPAWSARLRPAFEQLRRATALDAALALNVPGGGADFTAPPPSGPAQTWAEDLAAIRATPAAVARREVTALTAAHPVRDPRVRAMLAAEDAVARLADALDRAWHDLLAPDWPRVRAVCERDVQHRLAVIGAHGWAATVSGLQPGSAWRRGGLELTDMSGELEPVRLHGEGLLLIPSVFVGPRGACHHEEPWPKTVIYPARGTASLLDTSSEAPPAALAALLGRTRAPAGTRRPREHHPTRPQPRPRPGRSGRPPHRAAPGRAAGPRPHRALGPLPAHPARRRADGGSTAARPVAATPATATQPERRSSSTALRRSRWTSAGSSRSPTATVITTTTCRSTASFDTDSCPPWSPWEASTRGSSTMPKTISKSRPKA